VAKNLAPETAALDAEKMANDLLDAACVEVFGEEKRSYYSIKVEGVAAGKELLARDRDFQAAAVRLVLARHELDSSGVHEPSHKPSWCVKPHWVWVRMTVLQALLRRALPLTEKDLLRLVQWPARAGCALSSYSHPLSGIGNAAEHFAGSNGISPSLKAAFEALIAKLNESPLRKDCRKLSERLQNLISGGPQVRIEAGEAWSDVAMADLKNSEAESGRAWSALLLHCQMGGAGKFTERWRKAAQPLIDAVGFDAFKEQVLRWFPLVDKPRTQTMERLHPWEPHYNQLIKEPHVELLRGLVWCCGFKEDAELARAVARLALSAYRKIPGKGPRLPSLGNACVTALGMTPGLAPIGQLAILKVKVKSSSAQKEIEKAFTASANREGLARDEIEEMAVPSYGLEQVGVLRATFGDYQAELLVKHSSAALHWFKDGKPLKSAPASVKKEHPDSFKELQSSVKDVNAMIPVQRERIDALYLARKTWPLAVWKERYLDHPLIGAIARRLIWSFAVGGKSFAAIWHDDGFISAGGKPLTVAGAAIVSLWHPIGREIEDILGWRDLLERKEIVQPFKQAHREVYLLTDAERGTDTYSNRFAAHILRQHQFNALCAARGWKNKLRLMVDDTYPPAHRLLAQWNLRAEYWIEGAGTEHGRDTNESGTYLYLSTDQVRFYALDAPQLHAHAGGGGYGGRRNQTDDAPRRNARVSAWHSLRRAPESDRRCASVAGHGPAAGLLRINARR
jgi:hypothetical protein